MGTILSFTEDCLPPEQEYESRDALFKAINDWAAHRGYAFMTGRSTVEKSGRQTITQHLSAHLIHRKLPEEDQTQLKWLANTVIPRQPSKMFTTA
ncbi:Choline dehydrogenase [Fusarium oxysporum f. sp. albedinis]|nr:Choline dehydrogenase [Fusarium oxysporum f. sp. albedinis]